MWQPHATFGRRRLDLPGSWRTLVCLCPALRPRQDRCSQAIRDTGTAPANVTTKAHHDSSPFEAQSHGFGTGCLRFAPPVTRTGRKTRFRLLARLCRVGLVTHRIRTKGFHDASYIASPFPKLSWRKTFWNTQKRYYFAGCAMMPSSLSRLRFRMQLYRKSPGFPRCKHASSPLFWTFITITTSRQRRFKSKLYLKFQPQPIGRNAPRRVPVISLPSPACPTPC